MELKSDCELTKDYILGGGDGRGDHELSRVHCIE